MRGGLCTAALPASKFAASLLGVAQPEAAVPIRLAPAFTVQQAQFPPLSQLTGLRLPPLVAGGELDPPDFVPDTEQLITGRKAAGTPTVSAHLANHLHLSEACAIGTADDSLSGPLLQFIKAPPR